MTKNTKTQKTQKPKACVFVQNCKKKRSGNICIFCHNFYTNHNLDLFNTSKWPSEPQFCERWTYICKIWPEVVFQRSFIKELSFRIRVYVWHDLGNYQDNLEDTKYIFDALICFCNFFCHVLILFVRILCMFFT